MLAGRRLKTKSSYLALVAAAAAASHISCCLCQLQAGVYDFGQGRQGEKRGSWTPGEWLAAILLTMTILLGLALALGLCYYVNKRQRRQPTPSRPSEANYRRQQNIQFSRAGRQPAMVAPPDSSSKFVGLPTSGGLASNNTLVPIRNDQHTRQEHWLRKNPNESLIVQI